MCIFVAIFVCLSAEPIKNPSLKRIVLRRENPLKMRTIQRGSYPPIIIQGNKASSDDRSLQVALNSVVEKFQNSQGRSILGRDTEVDLEKVIKSELGLS